MMYMTKYIQEIFFIKTSWLFVLIVTHTKISIKAKQLKNLRNANARLQRRVSRKYEQNKEKGKYCKTYNMVKNKKFLLKENNRLTKNL